MKYILATLLVMAIFISSALAQALEKRQRNVATNICGTLLNAPTARRVTVAATSVVCERSVTSNVSSGSSYAGFSTPEIIIGTNGQFCQPITAGEMDVTDSDIHVYCADTTIADSAAFMKVLTTRRDYIAIQGIDSLAQSFDGVTLAEGVNTLDLEANELSADSQFVGDKISLFTTTGKYYGSSCITASTNANERVTTEVNLSALHAPGDYYVINSDAGCIISAAKIAPAAVTKIWAETTTELTTVLGTGAQSAKDMLRFLFERFGGHVVADDNNTQERVMYRANGTTKRCESNITRAGNVVTTGACAAPD